MKPCVLIVLALLLAAPAGATGTGGADPARPGGSAPASARAQVPKVASKVASPARAPRSASKASIPPPSTGKAPGTTTSARARASVAPAKAEAKPGAAPRRLEDIHIEGEIPVPQVLFITARDQRRFMDFHHRRYLRTSRELGEATAFPARIVVTGTGGNDDRKETTR